MKVGVNMKFNVVHITDVIGFEESGLTISDVARVAKIMPDNVLSTNLFSATLHCLPCITIEDLNKINGEYNKQWRGYIIPDETMEEINEKI